MPAPLLSSFAQGLYDALAPLARDDASNNYALAWYCAAIGTMLQEVEDYARDTTVDGVDAPGWSGLLDVNRAPSKGLGYLAQFVGVTLLPGLSDAAQRDRIRQTDGWNRGTPAAIRGAAQQYLTGAKTVVLRERDVAASASDPAYGLSVITYTSQTPDSAKVLAAIQAQKPAGIILRYVVRTGQDYQSIYTNRATYGALYSAYATYEGVIEDQPGT
jgi:hypothetical protein